MDRPPVAFQSLFSGTERCRLHLHGAALRLPADTRHQQREKKWRGFGGGERKGKEEEGKITVSEVRR